MYDVAIVGAGVIGVTSAYSLAQAGLNVLVLEKNQAVALQTSFANGGLITPSMAEPWAVPGLPAKMLKWIGREDAPFLLRPSALPGLWRWGPAFLANCGTTRWLKNSACLLELSRFSQACLNEIIREEGLDELLLSTGSLRIFSDEDSAAAGRELVDYMKEQQIHCRSMTAEQCTRQEPALLRLADGITGGIYYPDDQSGDCRLFTQKLAESCAKRGVDFRFDHAVVGINANRSSSAYQISTNRGELTASHVVFSTGMPPCGITGPDLSGRLLCYPVKGYSVTLNVAHIDDLPKIPLIDESSKTGIVPIGDKIRLVGTAEFCGNDDSVNQARTAELTARLHDFFPADWIMGASRTEWAGLRPMTPDGVPYIGQLRKPRIFVNVGHGPLGWTNACGAAVLIRDLLLGKQPEINPANYAPTASGNGLRT